MYLPSEAGIRWDSIDPAATPVSDEEVFAHLRFDSEQTQVRFRDQVMLYAAAATRVVEDIVGPLTKARGVLTVTRAGRAVLLPTAAAVLEVSVGGAPVTLEPTNVDEEAGIVYLPPALVGRTVTLRYRAGESAIPPNVRLAILEETRFLWQLGQQGPGRAAGGGAPGAEWTPSGFAVPRRVVELCAGANRLAGFA